MPAAISAFVITFNAEKKVAACLKSLLWASEIIVVDSFSTDKTAEICRSYGAKVILREFSDYAAQKNDALSRVEHPWALSIDSDEVVPDALREEILKKIALDPAEDAFRIRRESFIFGRKFRFSGTQDDAPVRLLRRGRVRFAQPIHEMVEVEGEIGRLHQPLLHYTYDSVSDYLGRFNRYTSLEARYLKTKNASLSMADYTLKPLLTFLRLYFWKQGFRDGIEGLLFCVFSAAYPFIKYAKYRESLNSSHAA